MASKRDLENISVAAAMFDANDVHMAYDLDSIWSINIPDEVKQRYQPAEMEIQGPFDDGSILVGLRLVPRE